MYRLIALAAFMLATATIAVGQVQTTTGEPLTVAGVPVYGVAENGDLRWYFHQGAHNGAALWANQGNAIKVGNSWNAGLNVFKGDPHGDGVIYRIVSNGDLYWYKHLGYKTGAPTWIEGKKVGNGWSGARLAFGAGNGVIYVVDKNGNLYWYRHLGYGNGAAQWANAGERKLVGVGWGGARVVFAGGNGVVYQIDAKGDLYWYRHTGYIDGTFQWTHSEGVKVGTGWNLAAVAFSGGDGIIYALNRNDDLLWYNNTGYQTGAATWTSDTGKKIGTGWGGNVRVF